LVVTKPIIGASWSETAADVCTGDGNRPKFGHNAVIG
jgi:hypothetical protein